MANWQQMIPMEKEKFIIARNTLKDGYSTILARIIPFCELWYKCDCDLLVRTFWIGANFFFFFARIWNPMEKSLYMSLIMFCRICHLVSFGWCFGYIVFFRTTHYLGLPKVVPHANAVQLLLTLKVCFRHVLFLKISCNKVGKSLFPTFMNNSD